MTPDRARALRQVAGYRALSIPEVVELVNAVLTLLATNMELNTRNMVLTRQLDETKRDLDSELGHSQRLQDALYRRKEKTP